MEEIREEDEELETLTLTLTLEEEYREFGIGSGSGDDDAVLRRTAQDKGGGEGEASMMGTNVRRLPVICFFFFLNVRHRPVCQRTKKKTQSICVVILFYYH